MDFSIVIVAIIMNEGCFGAVEDNSDQFYRNRFKNLQLFFGQCPAGFSGAHHHGECDSVVCITRGRVLIRFGERLENSAEAGPGDYVFIPAHVVHQEINLSDSEAIDSIVIRSGDNVVISVELPADVLQA